MQIDQMVEQLVTLTCADHQGADVQCRSCPQPAGPRPAKAGASAPPVPLPYPAQLSCQSPHRLALIAGQA